MAHKVKKFPSIIFILLASIVITCSKPENENPRVLMQTDLGAILIEVYEDEAPVTAANFLRYVDESRYDSAAFYRVVRLNNQPKDSIKIEVIQGGIGFRKSELRLPPMPHETTQTTGIRHKDGTVSMARAAPGTASSEIFICIGDQSELDFGGRRNPDGQGFAAFGQVIQGMEVVRAIQQQPTEGQMLVTPVEITEIIRKK